MRSECTTGRSIPRIVFHCNLHVCLASGRWTRPLLSDFAALGGLPPSVDATTQKPANVRSSRGSISEIEIVSLRLRRIPESGFA